MKPRTISEQLLFSTVRLETIDGSESGTGFFFTFKVGVNSYPVIITNKHVVRDNRNEPMSFCIHLGSQDGGSSESMKVTYQAEWMFHPTQDLCFAYAAPLLYEVESRFGKSVYFSGIDESVVPNQERLEQLSAQEEVAMVGYPLGLWDRDHNFPIFRRGYTAAHPAYDFNSPGIGLVDMACFPGSSDSPVILLNEGPFVENSTMYVGSTRVLLLGVLVAVPVYSASGQLVVQDIPTTQTSIGLRAQTMTNLGYYIKSSELSAFRKMILESITANEG